MPVITRFAPSPTGFLHIGGARTALFNWLFARHHGGEFRLRIEDTDRKRSTQEAIDLIPEGLRWLGLDWDGDIVFQFARAGRHAEVAQALLDAGKAYKCYCTPEELTAMREKARAEGRFGGYDGTWRDRDPAEAPEGVAPAVRFKAPKDGSTVINDLIQGSVEIANSQLDDMVLLRGDGTPTYMLSVVVDDYDMGITHVIRGDDHLTNAFRQAQLYAAMGWNIPEFAHIPLIHGADGAKLSKRHGALGVEAYRDMGLLPEAVVNYLLRLGWSHGDDEIISTNQAIEWFDLGHVGKSPARFDMDKLHALNGHYIRQSEDARLADAVLPLMQSVGSDLSPETPQRLRNGMPGLKERAKTLLELAENAQFYAQQRPLTPNDKAAKILAGDDVRRHIASLRTLLEAVSPWTLENLESAVKGYAEENDLKLGKVAQPLRAALTGSNVSPGIFDVMAVLGRDETLGRLDDAA
ncbi:MAG: glutamate--tRNA ligase [Magnetospiraceae bacterium]